MARGRGGASTSRSTMTRAESLSVVQTCLHSCLSTVLHARDLLPEKAFTHEKLKLSEQANGQQDVTMVMLQHGASKRADHLLSWLQGAFDTLRRGDLSGLQVCVHPDAKRRNRTIETYTFTIQYATGNDGQLLPTGVSLAEYDDEKIVNVDNVGEDLQNTLETITALCEGIPELPRNRFLSMNVFLLPHADKETSIEGFSVARRESFIWPRHNEWERQTEAFNTLSTDAYSTRLKISYMAHSHDSRGRQPAMEVLRDYTQAVATTDDIDWHLAKTSTKDSRPKRINDGFSLASSGAVDSQHLRQSSRGDSGTERAQSKNGEFDRIRDQLRQHGDIQDLETQIAAERMKIALNGMARPEDHTQGDTQAASLSLAPPPLPVVPDDVRLEYDYDSMYHKRADATVLRNQARELSKEIGGMTRSGQVILCQCAFSKEEGDMLRCSHCHTWQHAHCYGYVGKDDPRRPSDHICYVCFVDPKDSAALVRMIDLALARRAIYQAMRYGIMGKSDFAEKLGMDGRIAHPLFDKFKADGYVIAASGSHKAGFKSSGKPPWVPASGPVLEKMLDEYFDPIMEVERYFLDYEVKPSWLADKLIIPSVTQLPAAATPLAEKQKRKRAAGLSTSNLNSPVPEADVEMAGAGGTTRGGRTYKPVEEPGSSSGSEEESRAGKHTRSSAVKQDKPVTPIKRKLINFESSRIIDVCTNTSAASRKL